MKKLYVDLDVNKKQLLNAKIENKATAPLTPTAGLIYFNTVEHTFMGYTGTKWISLSGDKPGDIDVAALSIFMESINGRVRFDLSGLDNGQTATIKVPNDDVIVISKDVWDAIVNPTVTDDSSLGYSRGSHWLNFQTGKVFFCVSASPGAAVWTTITNYSKTYKNTFTSTTSLNLTHNLGITDLVYKIYKDNGDGSFDEFIPASFTILNANEILVTFSPACAGKIAIVGIE